MSALGKTDEGLLVRPHDGPPAVRARAWAGAGMRHHFLAQAGRLCGARHRDLPLRVSVHAGREEPADSPGVAEAAVRAAVVLQAHRAPELPLSPVEVVWRADDVTGNKRMSRSQASADSSSLDFRCIRLAGRHRAREHLTSVDVPMLFVQGRATNLLRIGLLQEVVKGLGDRATLHLIEEGDHSFRWPKRTGKTEGRDERTGVNGPTMEAAA